MVRAVVVSGDVAQGGGAGAAGIQDPVLLAAVLLPRRQLLQAISTVMETASARAEQSRHLRAETGLHMPSRVFISLLKPSHAPPPPLASYCAVAHLLPASTLASS